MTDALEKEYLPSAYESPQLREESPILPLVIRGHRAVESEDGSDNSDPPRAAYPKVATHRPSIPPNWPRHISTSSESMTSGQGDGSVYGRTSPTSPTTSVGKRPISPSAMSQPTASNMRTDYMIPDGRASGLRQINDLVRFDGDYAENLDTSLRNPTHGDVTDAIANAMQQLQRARLKEQSLRPLRFEPQDKFHRPDAALKEQLEISAFDELRVRRLNTRDWLLVAVWWLLKVCHTSSFHNTVGDMTEGSNNPRQLRKTGLY